MEFIFWLSIYILLYIFFGYPIVLTIIARYFPKPVNKSDIFPMITIIIPAHNEERVIAAKINNSLELDYPNNLKEIICASDGSTDLTVEIARSLLPSDNVLDIPVRQGKTNIINQATKIATGEIIIYTDSNILIEKQALMHMINNFFDPEIGCVAGQLTHINMDESITASSAGIYWRYEEFIKQKESETGSIMGADGGLFAIRKSLFEPLPVDIIDDYATSIGILTRGHRVVFEPLAKAFERASTKSREELRRKVRIATRSVSASIFLGRSLLSLSPIDKLKFVSHRVLRYMGSYFMLLALLANIILVLSNKIFFYRITLIIQIFFFLLGLIGIPLMNLKPKGLLKLIRFVPYFLSANLSASYGATKALLGSRVAFWESPKTSR